MTWRLALALVGMYVLLRLVIGIVDPSTMDAAHHTTMQVAHSLTR